MIYALSLVEILPEGDEGATVLIAMWFHGVVKIVPGIAMVSPPLCVGVETSEN